MEIIIDRKAKRHRLMMDDQCVDILGLEAAQEKKKHEIQVDKSSTNPVDRFLLVYSDPKLLLGKKAYAVNKDASKFYYGPITDVHPRRLLFIKYKGENYPVRFEDVITLEG